MENEQLQMDFFNTIHLDGEELYDAVKNVVKQNERIYQLMKLSGKKYTPFEMHRVYEKFFAKTPVTSIRRAMTTLTNDNRLIKLDEMKAERYGKPNYLWIAVQS